MGAHNLVLWIGSQLFGKGFGTGGKEGIGGAKRGIIGRKAWFNWERAFIKVPRRISLIPFFNWPWGLANLRSLITYWERRGLLKGGIGEKNPIF